jgi:hypothetical protein
MWNVMAVAEALGMKTHFSPEADECSYLEQQAEKKARSLVGMVQGTMGLEAQGLGSADVDKLVKQTMHKLLAGSRRKLWE